MVTIPQLKVGATNYLIAAFTVFWLGAWAFGEISVIRTILTTPPRGATVFMLFWLGGWTVGGILAMLMLRRLFQRPVPETIRVDASGLTIDLGIPPFQQPKFWGLPPWSSLFLTRTIIKVDRSHLKTLKLREGDTCNRLTVDVGADRIVLATGASDREREWLRDSIVERYGLGATA